jgi:hypothetical protein
MDCMTQNDDLLHFIELRFAFMMKAMILKQA